MSEHKLSIITINYNNLPGLQKTVESVILQTWRDFEYIVIDGGSADGSAEYIHSMQHHFTFRVSKVDKGIYPAMNKGITKAKGEYLLFLNSGDSLCKAFHGSKIIESYPTADLIYFDAYLSTGRVYKHPNQYTYLSYTITPMSHQCILYKRTLFYKKCIPKTIRYTQT